MTNECLSYPRHLVLEYLQQQGCIVNAYQIQPYNYADFEDTAYIKGPLGDAVLGNSSFVTQSVIENLERLTGVDIYLEPIHSIKQISN